MIMKNVFLVVFSLFIGAANAQSSADYATAIDSLKSSYNTTNEDGITKLFSDDLIANAKQQAAAAFVAEDVQPIIAMDLEQTGSMLEAAYIMDDEQGKSFLMQYENTAKVLHLALNKDHKITALRIEDY